MKKEMLLGVTLIFIFLYFPISIKAELVVGEEYQDDIPTVILKGVELTTDTNASTACAGNEYLAGDGTCQNITSVSDTDTNASTACAGTSTYLDGENNCDNLDVVYIKNNTDNGYKLFGDNVVIGASSNPSNYLFWINGTGSLGPLLQSNTANEVKFVYWNLNGIWSNGVDINGDYFILHESSVDQALSIDATNRDTKVLKNLNVTTGNAYIKGNQTLGQKITFALGEIIDNINDGWIKITGGLDVTGAINSTDWTNVSITESQVSDLSHTTDTNTSTACSGTSTYLDGENNCDDISSMYIDEADEGNLNVNSSNYWDAYNTANSTQFENNGGILSIVLSWFSSQFNTLFGLKTTDDLTQGSSNLYDNQSWNQSHANSLYVEITGDTMTGSLNISGANLTASTGQYVCLSQACDSWIKYELHNTTWMLNSTNDQWIVSNESGVFIQG